MCGIYAVFSSNDDASQRVFAGIKRIEYRGYDSWGVAGLDSSGQFQLEKHVGAISSVKKIALPKVRHAIGHTRWATHGGVTPANAHPHMASDGRFVVVHNGVVENYQQLKKELIDKGYLFRSETDTEVIVGLLEDAVAKTKGSQVTPQIAAQVFRRLAGRSTVAVLTKDSQLIAFRYGSPLVVARNDRDEVLVSSDVLSVSSEAEEYAPLDHNQILWIAHGRVQVASINDLSWQPVAWRPIELTASALDTDGHPHFMLKEMFEQGQVLTQVWQDPDEQYQRLVDRIRQVKQVYTLGAGSASFAAESLAVFLRLVGVPATGLKSYEADSYRHLVTSDDLLIVFSQSGETADTNEVVEWCQANGTQVASIVNMMGSTLTSLSDLPFMLRVGPEIGVASTKAYLGHLVWGRGVAALVGGASLPEVRKRTGQYQGLLQTWIEKLYQQEVWHKISLKLSSQQHLYILGRGELYPQSLEFALKMKEISYTHAEGFSGGELKHGVLALIKSGTPVICLVQEDDQTANMLSAVAEVKARGAWVIGVAEQVNELFESWLPVPSDDWFGFASYSIPAQFLTYLLAVERGFDPDKPRNLAKSVTVK